MQSPRIERIYTDGACSGNPGPGGWGVVMYLDNGDAHELGGADSKTTNNRMELQAAIAALQTLVESGQTDPVTLYTDSEYVKNGVTRWLQGWKKKNWKTSAGKPVLNVDLWQELDTLQHTASQQLSLSWRYVRGHTGDEGNERSDAIARAFSRGQPIHMRTGLAGAGGESGRSPSPKRTGTKTSGAKASPAKTSVAKTSEAKTISDDSSPPPENGSALDEKQQEDTPTQTLESSIMANESKPATEDADPLDRLFHLRSLMEILEMADAIAEQNYLLTTSDLACLLDISSNTVTNRGESWVWRNWLVTRVRQEGNQMLWQLERIS